MNLDDKQAEIPTLRSNLGDADNALSCAESCEAESDFKANVEHACAVLDDLLRALRALARGEQP